MAAAVLAGVMSVPTRADEPSGRQHAIEIRKFQFSPGELVVAPGDSVIWINDDLVPHTITADDGSWDSDRIDSGVQWQIVIDEEMSGTYFCRYHPSMTGRFRIVRR